MDFSRETILKAKQTKTVEELAVLAKEENIELSEEELEGFFAKTHPEMGEITDDELDNVAGGCSAKYLPCEYCGTADETVEKWTIRATKEHGKRVYLCISCALKNRNTLIKTNGI